MAHVTFSELRADLAKHFDQVEADRSEIVIIREDHEALVILPLQELEKLRETLHLLSTPANADRLHDSIALLEAGRGTERKLIEE